MDSRTLIYFWAYLVESPQSREKIYELISSWKDIDVIMSKNWEKFICKMFFSDKPIAYVDLDWKSLEQKNVKTSKKSRAKA